MPSGVYKRKKIVPTCHPDRPHGGESLCKSCYYFKHKDTYTSSRISRHANKPAETMIVKKRSDAKRLGVDFNITVEDLLPLPTHCPVLGIELDYAVGKGRAFNGPSIDRKDPNKGYLSGNVAVISKRANTLKSNASVDELQRILKYMNAGDSVCQ